MITDTLKSNPRGNLGNFSVRNVQQVVYIGLSNMNNKMFRIQQSRTIPGSVHVSTEAEVLLMDEVAAVRAELWTAPMFSTTEEEVKSHAAYASWELSQEYDEGIAVAEDSSHWGWALQFTKYDHAMISSAVRTNLCRYIRSLHSPCIFLFLICNLVIVIISIYCFFNYLRLLYFCVVKCVVLCVIYVVDFLCSYDGIYLSLFFLSIVLLS